MSTYTDITFILDRSGSMESVKSDTIEGFNRFLNDQKAVPGEATVSLYQFDDIYECVYEGKPLSEAPELTEETFIPRNYTALHDAICYTVNNLGSRFRAMEEKDRPDRVLVVILTDGLNNASKEFTAKEVNSMITHQSEVYKWEFTFLGANQNAITQGAELGIKLQNSMSYAANAQGTGQAFSSLSKRVSMYRQTTDCVAAAASLGFTDEDRIEQEKAGAQSDRKAISELLSKSQKPNLPK